MNKEENKEGANKSNGKIDIEIESVESDSEFRHVATPADNEKEFDFDDKSENHE